VRSEIWLLFIGKRRGTMKNKDQWISWLTDRLRSYESYLRLGDFTFHEDIPKDWEYVKKHLLNGESVYLYDSYDKKLPISKSTEEGCGMATLGKLYLKSVEKMIEQKFKEMEKNEKYQKVDIESYLKSIDYNLRQVLLDIECKYYKSPQDFQRETEKKEREGKDDEGID